MYWGSIAYLFDVILQIGSPGHLNWLHWGSIFFVTIFGKFVGSPRVPLWVVCQSQRSVSASYIAISAILFDNVLGRGGV